MAVIHHHGLGARRCGGHRADGPIAGDPDGKVTGQHQRLVADVIGGVMGWIYTLWAFQTPSVTARQLSGLDPQGREARHDFAHHRGLAGPAHCQIADADHRQARIERAESVAIDAP